MRRLLLLSVAAVLLPTGCKTLTEDRTIGQSSICEVHHVQMTQALVPFYHNRGTPMEEADLANKYPRLFPHPPRKLMDGGCVVYPDSPGQAAIYVCPECKAALKQWIAEHGKPDYMR